MNLFRICYIFCSVINLWPLECLNDNDLRQYISDSTGPATRNRHQRIYKRRVNYIQFIRISIQERLFFGSLHYIHAGVLLLIFGGTDVSEHSQIYVKLRGSRSNNVDSYSSRGRSKDLELSNKVNILGLVLRPKTWKLLSRSKSILKS